MAYIKTMKDTSGKTIYPQTHAQAVYASDGMTLEAKLNGLPTKISEFENDTGFITNTVDNLTNYYKKTELYTQTEVNNLINAITTMNVEVVTVLPTENISTTTIYLKAIEGEDNNNHEEWLYANGAWELIGTTAIDLTPYATKEYVNTALVENQADWNENDASATTYIENRTHYVEGIVKSDTPIYSNNNIEDSSWELLDNNVYVLTDNISINNNEIGQTLYISINGLEQCLEVQKSGRYYYVGNPALSPEIPSNIDTGEDYIIILWEAE